MVELVEELVSKRKESEKKLFVGIHNIVHFKQLSLSCCLTIS